MIFNEYIFKIKHDNGTFKVATVATSLDNAKKIIMNSERCPISSLQNYSVKQSTETTKG